jgi:putative inorganic carbon (hco3(-)) transporter
MVGLLAGLEAKLAISAALGLAFTLVALANLPLGLALFTFLGFVVVLPNFAGQTLSVIKIAALPLLISWLAQVSRADDEPTLISEHPWLSLSMLGLVVWALASVAWGEVFSIVLSATFRYALAVILVFVVFTAIRRERDLTMIATAMILGSVAAALYGFLHPASTELGQLERLSGTLGNPNELAAALTVGIALSGGIIVSAKGSLERWLAGTAIAICIVSILLTGSRGGLIALMTMLITVIVLAKGRRLPLILVGLSVVLLGIGYIVAVAPTQSRERFVHPGNGTGRTDIWTVGGRMVSAHPVLGVGAGNFTTASIHYLLQPGALEHSEYISDNPTVAQNMYLEVLAELGIPGIVFFVGIIVTCLGCLLAALARFRALADQRMAAMTIAVAAALMGLLASDIFSSAEYARNLWLLMGLGPALLAIAKRKEAGTEA